MEEGPVGAAEDEVGAALDVGFGGVGLTFIATSAGEATSGPFCDDLR